MQFPRRFTKAREVDCHLVGFLTPGHLAPPSNSIVAEPKLTSNSGDWIGGQNSAKSSCHITGTVVTMRPVAAILEIPGRQATSGLALYISTIAALPSGNPCLTTRDAKLSIVHWRRLQALNLILNSTSYCQPQPDYVIVRE
jgi:hypothetical protein